MRRDPLRAIAVGMAIAAVLAVAAGLVLVQRLGTTYRDALDVTVESAELAGDVAEQAVALPGALAELTRSVNATLDQVRRLTVIASDTGNDVADALGTNVAGAVEGTAGIADDLAGFVSAIERLIPGNSDSLAEDLRDVADGLAPVPDQLRSLADQLRAGADELDRTVGTLDELDAKLTRLSVDITTASGSLAALPAVADRLEADARAARDRVEGDLWLLRVIVVAAGGVLLAAAAGMWLISRRLPPATATAPAESGSPRI